MPTPTTPPNKVRRSLHTLGQDIRDARKRLSLSIERVALIRHLAASAIEYGRDLLHKDSDFDAIAKHVAIGG